IVARLLEAVIDATRSKLKLAKLEGDAAFFYLTYPEGSDPDLAFAAAEVATIHRAFHRRLASLEANNLCNCDACEQVGNLKIKFVAHLGDVAVQKVKRLTELAGVDVILVHRMLKNDVPVTEYLLMTEPVHLRLDESARERAAPLEMELEGLGQTNAFFVDLGQYVGDASPIQPDSFPVRLWLMMKMSARSMPSVIGLKKPLAGFRNINTSRGPADQKTPPS